MSSDQYNYVLEPCDIKEIIDDSNKEELEKRLKKEYLTDFRMEFYKSTSTKNLKLEDDYMEFITAKCIGGSWVGEGHCPIDITKNDKGIDVLCVCLNGNRTNEKSIMQNFTNCGNELDTLFEDCRCQEALSLYTEQYHQKLSEAKERYKLEELYYLAFISTPVNVYMSVFKINLDCISNIKYDSITEKKKSIRFKRFIDDKVGFTTLFKSKKRLEIRFYKEILNSVNTIKLI